MLLAAVVVLAAAVAVQLTRSGNGDGRRCGASDRSISVGTPDVPFSASVEITDPDAGSGRIEWWFGPELCPSEASTIVGYEVDVVVDGSSLGASPVTVTEPFLEADLWADFGRWDADVPFVLEARAQFGDGSWTEPQSRELLLPAIVPRATDWVVGPPETLVIDPGPNHGLPMWVDGTMGFAGLDSGVRAFGANGPSIASWDVGTEDFIGEVNATALEIDGQDGDYAAGGPVYVHRGDPDDPDDDRLIMIYHGEDHRQMAVDPVRWWGYLGMAISDDEGESFVDAGKIVAPEIPITQTLEWGVEVGGGAFTIVEDGGVPYFYVYFRDTRPDMRNVRLAVARAPVASVIAAAVACRPVEPATCVAPPFVKYDGEGWGEPAVFEDGTSGGSGADLLAPSSYLPTPIWFDVVELASRGVYVMVFSWMVPSDVPVRQAVDGWSYALSTSTDGVDWSRPVRLIDTDLTHEMIYLTMTASDLTSARSAVGDDLFIFRTRTQFAEPGPPGRWAGEVALERLALTYRP